MRPRHPVGIPFAAEIRHLRYLARKAAADYYAQSGPRVMPTDAERKTAVQAVLSGRASRQGVADLLGVHPDTVTNWCRAEKRRRAAK